jgi:hypothetical protein
MSHTTCFKSARYQFETLTRSTVSAWPTVKLDRPLCIELCPCDNHSWSTIYRYTTDLPVKKIWLSERFILLKAYKLLNTVKPALNGPFIKWKSVLNGNIFRSLD